MADETHAMMLKASPSENWMRPPVRSRKLLWLCLWCGYNISIQNFLYLFGVSFFTAVCKLNGGNKQLLYNHWSNWLCVYKVRPFI